MTEILSHSAVRFELATEFRKLVARGFTPRQVEAVEPTVRRFVVGRIERLPANGGGDILAELAATGEEVGRRLLNRSAAAPGLTLSWLAPIGSETPAVTFGVEQREVVGAVVGVVRLGHDLGAAALTRAYRASMSSATT